MQNKNLVVQARVLYGILQGRLLNVRLPAREMSGCGITIYGYEVTSTWFGYPYIRASDVELVMPAASVLAQAA